MTRIAALSDVHGNVAALEAVIADITREKPDRWPTSISPQPSPG
jgi:hypothetical protein